MVFCTNRCGKNETFLYILLGRPGELAPTNVGANPQKRKEEGK